MAESAYERGSGVQGKFRELIAWQKVYALSLEVYKLTAAFPTDERYGLTQQLRRAAVSVPSNVAEGWGRSSTADYVRFLGMARGSLYELQTQLWIAMDLGYVAPDGVVAGLLQENERLLNALIRRLQAEPSA